MHSGYSSGASEAPVERIKNSVESPETSRAIDDMMAMLDHMGTVQRWWFEQQMLAKHNGQPNALDRTGPDFDEWLQTETGRAVTQVARRYEAKLDLMLVDTELQDACELLDAAIMATWAMQMPDERRAMERVLSAARASMEKAANLAAGMQPQEGGEA